MTTAQIADPSADEQWVIFTDIFDEHVAAEFLHQWIWGVGPHDTEPGDGSDCHECYAQVEELIRRIGQQPISGGQARASAVAPPSEKALGEQREPPGEPR